MANKYLDQGGVEHLWSKIKSWANTQLSGKANSSHTHTYSQITNLSTWKTNNFGSGSYSISSGYGFTVNSSGITIGRSSATNVNKDLYVSGKAIVQGYLYVNPSGRVDVNDDCTLVVATPTSNTGEAYMEVAGIKVTRCSGSYYIYNDTDYKLYFIIIYGSNQKTVSIGAKQRQDNVLSNYTGPILVAWTKF